MSSSVNACVHVCTNVCVSGVTKLNSAVTCERFVNTANYGRESLVETYAKYTRTHVKLMANVICNHLVTIYQKKLVKI